jgi:subtilase family serine protease
VLTGVALVASLAATPSVAGSSSPTGWVSTHTKALDLRGQLIGATPVSQALEISVTLPLRDSSAINGLIESRTIMTPSQVAARFGPTQASVSAVESYLAGQGFSGISVSSNRLLVTADASAAKAERAFHTSLTNYRLNNKLVYANTQPALVPAALAPDVTAVLGLSDVPFDVPNIAATVPDTAGFFPSVLQKIYDATTMKPASGTTIAILQSGDETPIIANLRYAEEEEGYSQVPVQVIYDGPTPEIVNNNPLTGTAEWDLDVQMATMMAQSVKQLDIYDVSTYTDPEVARGINMFVAQDKATAMSVSLGECDYIAFLDGAMVSTDESLAEGALQGQSMFGATGDNGYACPEVASTGVPEGPPGVSWPGDGEYTTATGGTTLIANSAGDVSDEIAWVGGGGGISPWETAPPWTLQANPAGQLWEFTNQGGRGVPDVSADADGNVSPVLIYTGSKTASAVGGTSVDAPLIMGLWARIDNSYHDFLGLAQYNFYALYNAVNPATIEGTPLGGIDVPAVNPLPVNGFRSIVLGTNGGCVAKPGYNYCTGIGAPLAAELLKEL